LGVMVTMGFEFGMKLSRGRGYGDGLPRHLQVDLPRATRPDPIVGQSLIVGIHERIDAKGEVLLPLHADDVRAKVRKLVDQGAQGFVVALVNSVVNPAHEELIEEIIRDEYPSNLFGSFPVILSHRISQRKSEYARLMASVICGFLHEQMFYSLGNLEEALREREYRKPVLLIHNTGGMASLESTHALQTIHSGPVAGLGAAQRVAQEYGFPLIVATDMGGTSFDVGIAQAEGSWLYDFNPVIDRWLVSTPMVYLRTLGAGGGSIARYDRLWRTIQVGPDSAGSDPGPASYGRGGTEPTVSDADLVLGYLSPEYYANGTLTLDPSLAELVIEENITSQMGGSIIDAALLIKQKVDANMADAVFMELATRGYDPRKIVLTSYGGAGPVHCCGFAKALGVERVMIPPFSAVFSAFGAANLRQLHIHERSVYMTVYNPLTREMTINVDEVNSICDELEAQGRDDLVRQGFDPSIIKHQVEFEMRYGNQLVQLSVPASTSRLANVDDVLGLIEAFRVNYSARFGETAAAPEAGIKIVAVRLVSWVPGESVAVKLEGHPSQSVPKPTTTRKCYFLDARDGVDTNVYRFESLTAGARINGPAIVEAPHTTYVVEPGWRFTLGASNEAWVTRDSAHS
ncbi:MAG TPA: hydantoinase/oxoprolinase family protein, partial [Candidatus Binataceae bacterium]|nr:hydantoinase/oxoprolinase family protein [Candidatus Binataceae bacterium]